MSLNRVKVLVLGTGANGLGIIRALYQYPELEVWAVNFDPKEPGRFTRLVRKIDWPDPVNDQNEFQNRLFNFSRNHTRTILFPTRDIEVDVLAELSDSLPENLLYYRNSKYVVQALADKNLVSKTALRAGLEIPRTVILSEKINPRIVGFDYPVLIKPLMQSSKRTPFKNILINNEAEFEKIFKQYDNLLNHTVLQEFISGGDDHIYHCNLLIDNDEQTVGVVEFQKIRQYLPQRGMTSYGQIVLTRDLVPYCERLAHQVGYKGLMNVEFKKDAQNGRWVFIEANLRLPIFNSVFPQTGVDLTYLYVKSLVEKVSFPVFANRKASWIYEENDLANIITHKVNTSIWVWLRQFVKANSYAYWNGRDPLPGVYALGRMFILGLKRLFLLAGLSSFFRKSHTRLLGIFHHHPAHDVTLTTLNRP